MNDKIIELASTDPLKLKLKDIVEMTQSKALADIAKEYLPIGEKKIRDILKDAGCTSNRGKRGWTYEPDNIEVEKELGEFVKPKKARSSSKSKGTINNASNKNTNNDNASNDVIKNKDNVNDDNKNDSAKDDAILEIKELIKGKKKDENARIYKGIYFDRDIADFLDNVQHGNKSELVNKIMRQYLQDNELM